RRFVTAAARGGRVVAAVGVAQRGEEDAAVRVVVVAVVVTAVVAVVAVAAVAAVAVAIVMAALGAGRHDAPALAIEDHPAADGRADAAAQGGPLDLALGGRHLLIGRCEGSAEDLAGIRARGLGPRLGLNRASGEEGAGGREQA